MKRWSFLLLSQSYSFQAMALASSSRSSPSKHPISKWDDWTKSFHEIAAGTVDLTYVQVLNDGNEILTVERSVRDWDEDCRRKYLYHIPLLSSAIKNFHLPPTPLDKCYVTRLVSHEWMVQVMKDEKTQKTTRLEIYQNGALIHKVDLAKEECRHGSIMVNDATFGSPSLHADYLVYTAERQPGKKAVPLWSKGNGSTLLRGSEHVVGQGVQEDWGEQYATQLPLTDVFMLHLPTARVRRVPVFNDLHFPNDDEEYSNLQSVCCGQPVLDLDHKNNALLAMTVWDAGGLGQMSRRLGMVYCRNRPSQVVMVDVSNLIQDMATEKDDDGKEEGDTTTLPITTTVVSEDFRLARSPRFIPSEQAGTSSRLIFLGHKEGFHSHDGCMGLYCRDDELGRSTIREVVPVVDRPATTICEETVHGMGFPGIFTSELPLQCYIPHTNTVLLNTQWGSFWRIVAVDVVTGQIRLFPIPSNGGDGGDVDTCSYTLQHVAKDFFIVAKTSSNLPQQLWKVPYSVEEGGKWVKGEASLIADLGSMSCTTFSAVPTKYEAPFDVELLTVTPPSSETPDDLMQALLLLPRTVDREKAPLIVVPHGGPHGCSTSSFLPGVALLASRYAVLIPNYRGSTGFGHGPLTSLLGKIGRQDVDDVMTCINQAKTEFSTRIDGNRVALCGGSHGGFLTAHCTSQYPDFFRAAVTRNPVINIASMVTATDISDWCYSECLGETLPSGAFRGPTQEEIKVMYEKSPIGKVDQVKTPTLVALGLKDLRVPPSQGKEWYYTLRSRGIPTELLIYPEDNHSLSGSATEAEHWIRIMQWFERHL